MAVNVPVEVVGAGSGGIPELQPWLLGRQHWGAGWQGMIKISQMRWHLSMPPGHLHRSIPLCSHCPFEVVSQQPLIEPRIDEASVQWALLQFSVGQAGWSVLS